MGTRRDSFGARTTLTVGDKTYDRYDLGALERRGIGNVSRLPFSLKVLLENLLRQEDGESVRAEDIEALARWEPGSTAEQEIAFMPSRVLLQDFTGVPLVVDLAAMRDAIGKLGGDPEKINPLQPVDLVIDHSVQVDWFGTSDAATRNAEVEFQRNQERYAFLRWGQTAFRNFRVVPPDTGIVHQVNVEYLAGVVFGRKEAGRDVALFDTLVGTDSHTTMVNGLGVLGWGVGGIEAEAAMLGQPVSMLIPQVVGFRLTGALPPGTTATDLVLTVTQMLRKKGVVGKFVEYFGPGCGSLSVADRTTIANMAPEYGATCGFFPVDDKTLDYLRMTGRSEEQVALAGAYCKAQGAFRTDDTPDPVFTDVLELDLSTVVPSLAGPKRPQDRVDLGNAPASFRAALEANPGAGGPVPVKGDGAPYELKNGDVVIAAITSCTNTSNPAVLVAAGLLARKAVEKGLARKPWVKTSLAPGSKVVTRYLEDAGLTPYLDQLGFNLVGYGCTTCIGNSGPLPGPVAAAVDEGKLVVAAVLSGNRNFEGRISPQVRANYLASPPLVVAYALAGTMATDLTRDPLGTGKDGQPVYLKDLWPSPDEVAAAVSTYVRGDQFRDEYANVFAGDERWRGLDVPQGDRYAWDAASTYIRKPPFFQDISTEPGAIEPLRGMRALAVLGDSVTTDHISPAGNIKKDGPAGRYLQEHGVAPADFNSYGARRGNHEVMMRGTFANIRLRNLLVPGVEGGVTVHPSQHEPLSIFDASMRYQAEGVPLLILAGKEYGTGSSRDWAAKGTALLGVRTVLAESFERIHRSNLVGMGVLPLEYLPGQNRETHGLTGFETFDLVGLADPAGLKPRARLVLRATAADGTSREIPVVARLDTANEVEYYRHGGILPFVLRQLAVR